MGLESTILRARTTIEKLMLDTCQITRDPLGHDDDTWDPVNGVYTPNATTIVYTGKCIIKPVPLRADSPRIEGGETEIAHLYTARVPFDTPEVKPGDEFTLTVSTLDPHLVNKTYVVVNEQRTTFEVVRHISLEEVIDAFPGIRGS